MRLIVPVVLVVSLCCSPCSPGDDEPGHHHHAADERLGTVSFPVSCSPAVQKPFERGVALLHSFGYEEAEQQFEEVANKDPKCAMAHWGIAMSQFHQLWERPHDKALARGWQEAHKAQTLGAKTARERAYIDAIVAFYATPNKKDHLARATAYSNAMENVYRDNPQDVEAGAFYALSLLTSEDPKDESLEHERKAITVLNKLFPQQPDHPGLAHYLIHAADTPQLAPLGLDAARRYAEIAPSSAHAIHMPSHIFARLGLWQEDIASNEKSVAATHKTEAMYMHGHELHAMHFLEYAFLQTGQDTAANDVVLRSKAIVASGNTSMSDDPGMVRYYGFAAAHFPALYALETHDWKRAAALEPPADTEAYLQAITYWARTIGSARSGDLAATRENAKKYDDLLEATRRSKYAYILDAPRIVARDEVHAWLAFAEKNNEQALKLLREAANYQDKVGKAEVDIPAREMLADMLLELNRPQEAMAEYETSLKTDPNRFNGLYGAAHAAELAKEAQKASGYYAQLVKNCTSSQSERPELSRARKMMANAGAGN